MDEIEIYHNIRKKLESFIYDAFNVKVNISPRAVYFVDEIEGSSSSGLYDFISDVVIVEKRNLVDFLAHELLHHVGYTSGEFIFEPLKDNEYLTELLNRAFIKYAKLEEDVVLVYLDDVVNPYRRAQKDSIGKSWRELVEKYLDEVYNMPISVSIIEGNLTAESN